MASSGNGLGDLNILVGGDLGPLRQALDQIPQLAKAAGDAAAQALSSAASGSGRQLSLVFDDATTAAKGLEQAIQPLQGNLFASWDFEAAKTGFTGIEQTVHEAAAGITNAGMSIQEMGQSLKDAGGALLLLGAALSGISVALIAVGDDALDVAGKFERVHITLGVLMGSATAATEEMQTLVGFANSSGQAIDTMFKGFQNMLARGFDTSKANEAIQSLTAAAAAFNIPMDQMIRSFDSLQTRGTAALQQMARAGIPVWQLLAEAAGTSISEIRQIVQKGALDSEAVMDVLLSSIKEKYGAIPAQIASSWTGLKTQVSNEVELALNAIGAALLPAAKSIAAALIPIIDAVKRAAEEFASWGPAGKALALTLGTLLVAVGPLTLAIGGFIFTLGQLTLAAPVLSSMLGIELPAAFGATGTAAAAAAVEVEAAGVAAGAAAAETGGMGLLAASVSKLGAAAAVAATAFASWKLGSWLYENIPLVQQFGDAIGKFVANLAGIRPAASDAAQALSGLSDKQLLNFLENLAARLKDLNVEVPKSTTGWTGNRAQLEAWARDMIAAVNTVDGFNHAIVNQKTSIDLVEQGVDKLLKTQQEANDALARAQKELESVQQLVRMGVAGNDELVRATNAVTDAYAKAHPVLKGVSETINLQQNATRSLGEEWGKFLKVAEKIPGDMSTLRKSIIDGLSVDSIVKSLDSVVQRLTSLGADGDKNLSALRDSAVEARASFVAMLQSLDPTQMQAFEKNGVEVLRGGIVAAGASAQEMSVKIAKSMGISQDAADKLVKAWQIGMRDAGASLDGFTTKVTNGVTMIEPFTDAIKKHGEVASHASQGVKDLAAAMDLISQRSQIGADNLGKVTLGVQQLITAQANSVNSASVAKQIYEDINQRYREGSVSLEVLQVAIQNYIAAVKSAVDPTGALGGSIDALDSAANRAGGDVAKAASKIKEAAAETKSASGSVASSSNLMSHSFMDGMNGMTVSGETFIAMLAEMGASLSDVSHAAQALGYQEIGINQFINEAGAKAQGYSDQLIQMMFHPNEYGLSQLKIAQDATAAKNTAAGQAAADAAAALAASLKAANDQITALGRTAADVQAVMQGLGVSSQQATQILAQGTAVYDAYGKLIVAASGSIGNLSTAATSAASSVTGLAGSLSNATQSVSSTADMWAQFPEAMGRAQNQTIDDLMKLGVNFYDAVAATHNLVDNFDQAAAKLSTVSASIGTAVNPSGGTSTDTFNNLLKLGVNFYDAVNASQHLVQGFDEAAAKIPQAARIITNAANTTVGDLLNLGLNFYDAVNASQNLVKNFDEAAAAIKPAAAILPPSPGTWGYGQSYSAGRSDAGSGIIGPSGPIGLGAGLNGGTSFGMESVPGITINVTGNQIMDQATVNSLTNRIASSLTGVLRMNAGLKV